jgi:hypothetical protein
MSDTSSLQLAAGMLQGGQAVGTFVSEQRQAGAIDTATDFNTRLAALQANDAIRRGNVSARMAEVETKGIVGKARAGLAAQGVALDSGSALEIQAQDAGMGALDAQMIRNNAAREAWGITTENTINALGQKQRAGAIRAQSYTTLATGAARTYGIFWNPKTPKTPSGVTAGQATSDPSGSGADGW